VHKTANVLYKMPKKVLRDIYLAPRRVDTEEAFGEFPVGYN
jgi:hypothetical protein